MYMRVCQCCDPTRIRTGVTRMRTWRPRPLDDGAEISHVIFLDLLPATNNGRLYQRHYNIIYALPLVP